MCSYNIFLSLILLRLFVNLNLMVMLGREFREGLGVLCLSNIMFVVTWGIIIIVDGLR